MKSFSIPFSLILSVLTVACNRSDQNQTDSATETVQITDNYKIPEFTDRERTQKIAIALKGIEDIYKACAEENRLPGIAYGVVVDNKLVLSDGYGTINLTTQQPVTDRSLFRIASMTKSFTAMAILRLRDENAISLQDHVVEYIPEIEGLKYLTEDATPVTIHNLLTMTSGFPEDNPWGDRFLDITDQALMDLVEQGISVSTLPSYQYEYSNLGYGLLGIIISRVSGMPYQEYITKHILDPLGLHNTFWEYAEVPDSLLAVGYVWTNGQWEEEPILHDGAFGAMGGLITSIVDFSKYVSLHLSAWPPRNDPDSGPVKRSTLREMQRMNDPVLYPNLIRFGREGASAMRGYGFGLLELEDDRGIVEVGHNGGLPGYGSSYMFYPRYGIGIMAFGNLRYVGGTVKSANYKVIQKLIEEDLFNPRILPVSEILAERKEQVIRLIQTWDTALEQEILAENFFLDHPREERMDAARKALSAIGEIEKIEPLVPENQLRGSFIIRGSKGSMEVYFTLSPEPVPKVQWLSYEEVESH